MERNSKLAIPLFLLMLAGHVLLAYGTARSQTIQLFAIFGGLFALYVWLYRIARGGAQLRLLLTGAVGLRLVWLFAFPALSDDWARFVWDGRLQAAGYNPFDHLPSELMKGGLPGSSVADLGLYRALNSPDYFTIYPPVLQGMFACAAKLAPHSIYWNVVLLKLFIFIADFGSILLLQGLCKAFRLDARHTLLYALNPLVIAELIGNVHHEGIVIFCLLALILAVHRQRFALAILALAGAAATKLVPLIFLPLMFFYYGWRRGLFFCCCVILTFAASWLPFVNHGLTEHATASVGLYYNLFEFNAGIYYLVRDIVFYFTEEIEIERIAPVLGMLSALLIGVYAYINRNRITAQSLPRHLLFSLGIYLAFTTMVHPWYITPLIVLACFTTLRFPLVWSALIVGSYYEYHAIPELESAVQLWMEYMVVAAVLVWDLRRLRQAERSEEESFVVLKQ